MGSLRNLVRDISSYRALTDLATAICSPCVTVLMLHRFAVPELGVRGITADYLRQCLSYLQQNDYVFIAIDEAVTRLAENNLEQRKWVAFTLDDGMAEQTRLGADVFAEFSCPTTCFLVTDFIDGKQWPWDYQLMYLCRQSPPCTVEASIAGNRQTIALGTHEAETRLLQVARNTSMTDLPGFVAAISSAAGIEIPKEPPPAFAPTSWEAVREAEAKGMRFGAHSASHRLFAGLDDAALQREIADSVQRVRAQCHSPSEVFCYPSGKVGEFDARAIEQVRQFGMKAALSAEPGYLSQKSFNRYSNFRYTIPRIPLPREFEDFKVYVSWAQRIRESLTADPLEKYY